MYLAEKSMASNQDFGDEGEIFCVLARLDLKLLFA